MSGPKSSRYTLTPEQRRILAEQRKIERRKAVATEKIRKAQKQLLQIGGMFNSEKQIASELFNRTGNDNGMTTLISELETLITPIQPLVSRTNYEDVNSVEETANAVCACLKEAEKISSKISSIAATNEGNLKANLSEAIDQGFATSFADIKEIKTDTVASLRIEAAQRLEQISKIDFLPHDYKCEISRASTRLEEIADEIFLKNFVAVSVNPLIRQANQFIAEYRECQAEFDSLYTEYTALCELYYYVAQEYVCSRSSIQILEAEIARIKKAVAEDDEQAYISDCLDEVMVEMGYSVLGSREVTKRNGKRFRNELYAYGDGTAVNVTYSSDGKIAMELGGIDTSDRVPTAQETDKLCDSMEQFCDDFKEIEKRLLAKGVVLADRISLLPPDAEYAQIINTSDYSMETEADTISVKKQRRSVSKQKALRRE
jgi:hypothetical protein